MFSAVPIDPKAVYDDGALCETFGLTPATLTTARKAGTLRFTRKGKRILYLGEWILAWLSLDDAAARQGGGQ